jgi:mRNA interferase RelE/StbE
VRVAFRESFEKDLHRIGDTRILERVKKLIESVEISKSLRELKNLKKLKREGYYYRVRVGDYRIGLVIEGDLATFVRFLHRKDLYRYFP